MWVLSCHFGSEWQLSHMNQGWTITYKCWTIQMYYMVYKKTSNSYLNIILLVLLSCLPQYSVMIQSLFG